MARRRPRMTKQDVFRLRLIADLMGAESAAHRAVTDWERRRAAGEAAYIFQAGQVLFVGPDPAPSDK